MQTREDKNANARAYRKLHRKRISELEKRYRDSHKEQVSAQQKAYKERNKEKAKAQRKIREAGRSKDMWVKNKPTHYACRIKRKYGITTQQVAHQLDKQKHRCAVCGDAFTEKTYACIDHCHIVGHFRGLLCHRCNAAEGLLRTPENVLRLYNYMQNNALFYAAVATPTA